METKKDVLEQVQRYVSRWPNEKESTQPLIEFLNSHEGYELIDRKNFVGHITTSAFIVDEKAKSLLLLKHKSLNRWLQPGGHVDSSDTSIITAALREANEETGLASNELTLLSNNIFDLDSHHIPANPKKNEPAHVHHDIRFLFQTSNASVNISLEESTASQWVLLTNLRDNKDFYWVDEKLKAFII